MPRWKCRFERGEGVWDDPAVNLLLILLVLVASACPFPESAPEDRPVEAEMCRPHATPDTDN